MRRLVDERRVEHVGQRSQRRRPGVRRCSAARPAGRWPRPPHASSLRAGLRRGQSVADGGKIARAAALEGKPRQRRAPCPAHRAARARRSSRKRLALDEDRQRHRDGRRWRPRPAAGWPGARPARVRQVRSRCGRSPPAGCRALARRATRSSSRLARLGGIDDQRSRRDRARRGGRSTGLAPICVRSTYLQQRADGRQLRPREARRSRPGPRRRAAP